MDREFITFTLPDDSQEYRMTYDFNELCKAEEVTGLNLLEPLTGRGITARHTRALLYACLRTAHPIVTLDEAGGLLTRDRDLVLGKLAEALQFGQSAAEEAE